MPRPRRCSPLAPRPGDRDQRRSARRGRAEASELQKPSFVVIQTDDETMEELYDGVHMLERRRRIRDAEHAAAAGRKRRDLHPLLHALLALRPLPRQPPHRPLRPQQPRPGQRPAERRLDRLPVPPRLLAQPRDLAAGRRLPHDPHRQDPQRLRRRALQPRHRSAARLELLALDPQLRHRPLRLRLPAEQQRRGRRALRQLGHLGNARIRRNRRRRLPLRAAERQTVLLRDRQVQRAGDRRTRRDLAGTAVLHAGRLHLAARGLPQTGRPAAGDPGHRPLRRGAAARQPRRRLQRGQRQRQAPLHPRSALPQRDRNPHLPRLLPELPRTR